MRTRLTILGIFLVAMLLVGMASATTPISRFYIVPTDNEIFYLPTYQAMVYISGTDIIAVNSTGAIISNGTAGTDDTTVIQAAMDSLTGSRTWKEKVVLKGHFVILTPGLKIPSYTTLDMIGAEVTWPTDAGYDLFNNDDDSGGNTNIEAYGGIITAGASTGMAGVHAFEMTKVTNLAIHDIYFHDTRCCAIVAYGSSNVRIYNNRIEDTQNDSAIVVWENGGVTENIEIINNQIQTIPGDAITIRNVTMLSIIGNTVRDAGAIGIVVSNSTGSLVDNRIEGSGTTGITITQGGDLLVAENFVSNSATVGIDAVVGKFSIMGNTVKDTGGGGTGEMGIRIGVVGSYSQIVDNYIYDGQAVTTMDGGIEVDGDNILVDSNYVSKVTASGINVYGDNNSITNNFVQNSGWVGIHLVDANNNRFSGNYIRGSSQEAIYLDGDSDGNVFDSTVTKFNGGSGSARMGAAAQNKTVFWNNIFNDGNLTDGGTGTIAWDNYNALAGIKLAEINRPS